MADIECTYVTSNVQCV